MKYDSLSEFVQLQNALTAEKTRIEERLRELNEVFGEAHAPREEVPVALSNSALTPIPSRRRGRGSNDMTLKEAILRVTSAVPLSRKEIVEAVQKIGYRFNSKDPLNLLGTVIYGKNPKFRNDGGKYTPVGQPVDFRSKRSEVSTDAAAPSANLTGKGKRTMGPKQKAKLAVAARKRWKAARAAGRTTL